MKAQQIVLQDTTTYTYNTAMTDNVDQEDEIGALQSIYNEEEFNSSIGEDGLRAGSFSAFINLPPGFRVLYETFESKDNYSESADQAPLEVYRKLAFLVTQRHFWSAPKTGV